MSRKAKGLMQDELKRRFADVAECAVVSIRGIPGTENNQLRSELTDKDIRLTVVKNSLAARAFAELGRDNMKELFDGPCALVYGGDSIVDVVKALVESARRYEPPAGRSSPGASRP